ncbi:MAG: hypothetical protein NUV61_01520 [Candidatus Azambacteria bacterium]|nr:hypothetical protein [Candidatus Azambacteria bacterium]
MRKLAISITAYSTASIIGPLIVFGGAGYFLSKYLGGGKTLLFVGVGIAFVATGVLQFFKIRTLLKKLDEEQVTHKITENDRK